MKVSKPYFMMKLQGTWKFWSRTRLLYRWTIKICWVCWPKSIHIALLGVVPSHYLLFSCFAHAITLLHSFMLLSPHCYSYLVLHFCHRNVNTTPMWRSHSQPHNSWSKKSMWSTPILLMKQILSTWSMEQIFSTWSMEQIFMLQPYIWALVKWIWLYYLQVTRSVLLPSTLIVLILSQESSNMYKDNHAYMHSM